MFRLVPCKLYMIDLVLWHVYFSGFAVKFARLRDGKDLVKTLKVSFVEGCCKGWCIPF